MSLPIKPLYEVREIADALGMSPDSTVRWLRVNQVRLTPRYPRQGRRIRVSFNAFVDAFPDLAPMIEKP
jgi:hypothetical protein